MNKLFKIILISFFCFSCSKDISKDNKINQKALDLIGMENIEKTFLNFHFLIFQKTEI